MRKILIGNIIDTSSGLLGKNKAIIIDEGSITAIVDKDKIEEYKKENSVTDDYSDKYIIPGLIDSHLHLVFSGGDAPLQDFLNSDNEALYNLSLKNAQKALEVGITTVRDCGSISEVTFRLRDDINLGKISGARIITSGEAITTKKGHIYFIGKEAETSDEMIAAAKELIEKGADFIKLIISGGNMTPGSSDLVDQYSFENIKDLVDYVHSKDKKVMAHVHTKEGMKKSIDAGVDFIEHGSWRVPEGVDIDMDRIKEMFDKGIIYCTALPKSYLINSGEIHKNRILTTLENMKFKENVVLGTDGGTTNNSVKELISQAIFLKEKGSFTNLEILQMMTLHPGKYILDGKVGEISKGKIADLVILDKNPVENLGNLREIAAVYKEGKKTR